MSLILFITSLFVFLSGMLPFSEFGISLVFACFLFWGRKRSVVLHGTVGVMAGAVIDSFSVFPFGVHIIVFLLLALFALGTKVFLKHRYLWGDLLMITGALIIGYSLMPIITRMLGHPSWDSWISGSAVLGEVISIAVISFFVWILLRYEYSYSLPDQLRYER